MKQLDIFGSQLEYGTNLSVLEKAREYFREEDIEGEIIRYYYCRDVGERKGKHVKPALCSCSICGKKLYTIKDPHSSADSISNLNNSLIQHKRYLKFISSDGQEYKTCYQFKNCLKKEGFKYKENQQDYKIEEVPDFREFFNIDEETIDSDYKRMTLEDIESSYKNYIIPFIKKWGRRRISKKNVINFFNDYQKLHKKHFIYYKGKLDKNKIIKKIFKIIGVKYD